MNPLHGKTITVTYGLMGSNILLTKTGKFKEILSFAEGTEFLILSNNDSDILINMNSIISWSIKSPPLDYISIQTEIQSGAYIG